MFPSTKNLEALRQRSLGHNNNKEKTMTEVITTDYEITEQKTQTGYIDRDGKFHYGEETKTEIDPVQDIFVQVGEDAAE